MSLILFRITNPMIAKAGLPDHKRCLKFFLHTIRESPFYELHCFLQRDLWRGRDEQMKVIGHDYELMKKKTLLLTTVLEYIHQQSSHAVGLEESTPFKCDRCNKEGPNCLR